MLSSLGTLTNSTSIMPQKPSTTIAKTSSSRTRPRLMLTMSATMSLSSSESTSSPTTQWRNTKNFSATCQTKITSRRTSSISALPKTKVSIGERNLLSHPSRIRDSAVHAGVSPLLELSKVPTASSTVISCLSLSSNLSTALMHKATKGAVEAGWIRLSSTRNSNLLKLRISILTRLWTELVLPPPQREPSK